MLRNYSRHFLTSVRHTLELEGVFSNHTWDPGGKTKYGITDRVSTQYGFEVETLTIDQATYIYHEEYWSRLSLDSISEYSWRVAAEIFDTAVNCGIDKAVRIVQEALSTVFDQDVVVDGKYGPKTKSSLITVISQYELHLLAALNGFQFEHYLTLLRRGHPAAKHAIKGWMRRLTFPTVNRDAD